MTAKVIPIFDNPGFFGGCKISDDEAPVDITRPQEPSYDYHAVLRKGCGRIEPVDFLMFARRLTVLCFQVYKRATWELRGDVAASFNFLASNEPDQAPSFVARSDMGSLNYSTFQEEFGRLYSMGLCISQKSTDINGPISQAFIEWNRSKPETIFISAHNGRAGNSRTGDRQLQNLLTRKMFYVPGAPPNHRFSVSLGFDNYNDELLKR